MQSNQDPVPFETLFSLGEWMNALMRGAVSALKVVPLVSVLWTCTSDGPGIVNPDAVEFSSGPAATMATVQVASSSSVLVRDGFSRTLSSGWGAPEAGGLWRISSGDPSIFQVSGGQGLIIKPDNGPRNAVATEGYGLNVAGLASFSIDTPPDHPSRYYTVQVYALRNDRESDGDNYYRYRVRAHGNGKMDVRVEKNVRGVDTWLGNNRAIDAVWVPRQKYWIRWECMGTSPATGIRMRVWADGTAEPTGWDVDVTVNEPALDHPGTTGFRVSGPNGSEQVTFPVTFRFDDLEYVTFSNSTSPNQPPVAQAGGPYSGSAGSAITFSGSASSDPDGNLPLSYSWNFGDGSSGGGATPTHTYATAGTYTVLLTVTDSMGASSAPDSTTATISDPPDANQPPIAEAGGPYSGTEGVAIPFDGTVSSDPEGGPLSYVWNFGDGSTGTGATPSHSYGSQGTYTAVLSVADSAGLNSAPDTAIVTVSAVPNQPPVAQAGGPYSGSAGSAIAFNGSASSDPDGNLPLSYSWNFGDGSSGGGATPSHTYSAAGTYTVTLQVIDAEGLASGPAATMATVQVASSSSVLVRDGFSRTLSSGWGAPEAGGLWRISSGDPSIFQVSGGQGLIIKPDNGPRNAVATEGYGLNVAGLASFSIDTPPDHPSRYYTVQVYALRNDRESDGDNYYRYRVRAHGNGKMDVRVEKNVRGVDTWLGNNRAIDAVWVPRQKYWIRWECMGTSPATGIRMRVWADGTAEPTGWDVDVTVNEPALDHPGTTGFRVSGPNGSEQVTFPVTFRLDDLEYVTKR